MQKEREGSLSTCNGERGADVNVEARHVWRHQLNSLQYRCQQRQFLQQTVILESIYANSARAEGLQFEVSSISWDRQNPKGVRVPKTALPPLDGDDGRPSFDDVQVESILQSETNAIVNLSGKHT